jgi:hypothetical protein
MLLNAYMGARCLKKQLALNLLFVENPVSMMLACRYDLRPDSAAPGFLRSQGQSI